MKVSEDRNVHIKSYFAASVQAAIEQAGRELGPDALIVNTREAPPEAQHAGKYEVVFALNPGSDATAAQDGTPRGGAHAAQPHEKLYRELGDLRQQIGELRACIQGEVLPGGGSGSSSEMQKMLVDRGITPDLAGAIVKSLRQKCGFSIAGLRPLRAALTPVARKTPEQDPEALWDSLPAEMESRLSVDAGLPSDQDAARAVALIGPPGAGKTTTLVKLALTYGLQARRSIQFLSLDTVRIAAIDQLRSYAGILGVGLQALETTHAVEQALAEHRNKGLIFIDTAGYSRASLADAGGLAHYLAGNPRIDTHLVLSASMKSADLERTIDSFAIFKPARLIFTKLDETDSFGSIYSAAARTGIPISFLANGQSVPDDLEPAAASRIIDLILPDRARRAESVA